MIYRSKPVFVLAQKITAVGQKDTTGNLPITLEGGQNALCTVAMQAKAGCAIGDYWIVESNGAVRVESPAYFEQGYEPVELPPQ